MHAPRPIRTGRIAGKLMGSSNVRGNAAGILGVVRLALFLAVALPAFACADHLIAIPVGKKVPFGTLRYETFLDKRDPNSFENRLDLGLNTLFDASLRLIHQPGTKEAATVDLAYNYVAPIVDITPGLSAGVLDAANRTADGRRGFGAITFRSSKSSDGVSFLASETTLGFTAGRHGAPFVGVMIPYSESFRLLAEHDGWHLNAGVEVRPIQNTAFRWVVRDGRPAITIQSWTRF